MSAEVDVHMRGGARGQEHMVADVVAHGTFFILPTVSVCDKGSVHPPEVGTVSHL